MAVASDVDIEIQKRVENVKNLEDVHATSVMEEELAMRDLLGLTVDDLASWLSSQIGAQFDIFKKAFLQHKIDGKCFLHLGEHHLQKMEPTSTIGERLNIIAMQQKVARLARVARRNHVIMEGNCNIETENDNVDGRYVLTNAALKIIFQKSNHDYNYSAVGRFSGEKVREKLTQSTFVDHIDLSMVNDVDIEQVLDTQELYRTEITRTGCLCMTQEKKEIILESRQDTEVAKIFISVNAGKSVADYERLIITPESIDEARRLQACIIDAMEEVQQVQHVHQDVA